MKTETGIRLIVGLGNPGSQYENTRHNVGFWLIKSLAEKQDENLKHEVKFKSFVGTIKILTHECKLLMPTTFMNLSGEAVQRFSNFYKIPVESILVVHDELDFLPGDVRLKKGGGANSHNGIQNIIDKLGNNHFWRLRIGISKPPIKKEAINYVISSPPKAETKQICESIDRALAIIPDLVFGNFEKAVQTLHTKQDI